MSHSVLQKLYDLSFAIFGADYDKIRKFPDDTSFPINLYFPRFQKQPRDQAIATQDSKLVLGMS